MKKGNCSNVMNFFDETFCEDPVEGVISCVPEFTHWTRLDRFDLVN